MPLRARGMLLIVAAAVLWSFGGALIKATENNPAAVATYRSVFAGAFLAMVMLVRRTRLTGGWRLGLLGLTYAGTMFGFVIANRLTTAAAAISLQYTAPIWVLLFGAVFLRELPRRAQLPAFVLCAIGTALFFFDDLPRERMTGNVMALFSGLCFASLMILTRSMRAVSPVTLACAGNLSGAAIMAVGALFWTGTAFGPPDTSHLALGGRDIMITALMGVVQIGIPYVLFSQGIRYVKAYEASVLGLTEPMLNPVWVFLIHHETPTMWMLGGAAMILSGILFIVVPGRGKMLPPSPD